MNRREEIIQASKIESESERVLCDKYLAQKYFIKGAEWADEHPRN